MNDSWTLRPSSKFKKTTNQREKKNRNKKVFFVSWSYQIVVCFSLLCLVQCGLWQSYHEEWSSGQYLDEESRTPGPPRDIAQQPESTLCQQRLGISRVPLQNLLKFEEELRQKKNDGQDSPARKEMREGKDQDIVRSLFKWFNFVRIKITHVNGLILMQKANQIAQAAGHTDFKADEGRFYCWQKRDGLTSTVPKNLWLLNDFFVLVTLLAHF